MLGKQGIDDGWNDRILVPDDAREEGFLGAEFLSQIVADFFSYGSIAGRLAFLTFQFSECGRFHVQGEEGYHFEEIGDRLKPVPNLLKVPASG